jgi:hypothetical protein
MNIAQGASVECHSITVTSSVQCLGITYKQRSPGTLFISEDQYDERPVLLLFSGRDQIWIIQQEEVVKKGVMEDVAFLFLRKRQSVLVNFAIPSDERFALSEFTHMATTFLCDDGQCSPFALFVRVSE